MVAEFVETSPETRCRFRAGFVSPFDPAVILWQWRQDRLSIGCYLVTGARWQQVARSVITRSCTRNGSQPGLLGLISGSPVR